MATGPDERALDAIDRRIVDELVRNARVSIRALAEHAHISRAHAYTRLERLVKAGVIKRYTVSIAHRKAGLGTSAYIGLSIKQESWPGVCEQLKKLTFVEHVSLLGGDFDVLVLARAPDNDALRHLVLDQLQGLRGVLSTKTWLIFDEADGPGAEWI